MFVHVLVLICLIVHATCYVDPKFLTSVDNSACGNNFEVVFEIFPTGAMNDVGGILHITNDLLVKFGYMTTELKVLRNTNQGVIELASSVPLKINEWSAVKIDLKRRSIGLGVGGASFVNEHLSYGHIHGYKGTMETGYMDVDIAASALIKNVAISCTKKRDSPTTDYINVDSYRYKRWELKQCRIVSYDLYVMF